MKKTTAVKFFYVQQNNKRILNMTLQGTITNLGNNKIVVIS